MGYFQTRQYYAVSSLESVIKLAVIIKLMTSSDEAKTATHLEFEGIINFLQEALKHQQAEYDKYLAYKTQYHLLSPFIDVALLAVKHRQEQTKAQILYYQQVLARYIAEGRA